MATRLAETYEEDSLTAVIAFVQNLLTEGQVRGESSGSDGSVS